MLVQRYLAVIRLRVGGQTATNDEASGGLEFVTSDSYRYNFGERGKRTGTRDDREGLYHHPKQGTYKREPTDMTRGRGHRPRAKVQEPEVAKS